jgi:transcriptional regulator with XRE-family HTH domain
MPQPNNLLRKEREARGWSQEKLAELIKADPDSVRNWEAGRRKTSLYFQTKLVDVFGLPPEQLGLRSREAIGSPLLADPEPAGESFAEADLLDEPLRAFLLVSNANENRHRMLQQVRSTWIESVLAHALRPGTFLMPSFTEAPEALSNPWQLQVQETASIVRAVPPGVSLLHLYERANEELLILGDPGAGKTTLLLGLASELLRRAEQQEDHAIPVIFNLTSWTKKRLTFAEWLREEMRVKYHVPTVVAQEWLDTGQVILLLDSLDEVPKDLLSSCIKAIQEYQQGSAHVPLVICCRREEYVAQTQRLSLQQALLIQPLTREQMSQYLSDADEPLEGVQQAFQQDPELEHLCTNPLMLNTVARTYQAQATVLPPVTGSRETQWHTIFQAYVKRMLERRGTETRYATEQTLRWLSFLARQMRTHQQSEMYLERLQPSWLPQERLQYRYRSTVRRIVSGGRSAIVAGLFTWILGEAVGTHQAAAVRPSPWWGSDTSTTLWGWMTPALGSNLDPVIMQGLVLALGLLLLTLLIGSPLPRISLASLGQSLTRSISRGLLVGGGISVSLSVLFAWQEGFWPGLVHAGEEGIFCGLFAVLFLSWSLWHLSQSHQRSFTPEIWRGKNVRTFLGDLGCASACAGMGYGLVSLLCRRPLTWNMVLLALLFGLVFQGDGWRIRHLLQEEIRPTEHMHWSWQAARHRLGATLGKGGAMGLVVALGVGLTFGAAGSLSGRIDYSFHYGLIVGVLIGGIGMIAAILTGILNQGWSSSILERHQRFSPNEGVHRSLRNALCAAGPFALVGGVASGAVSALAFGLVGKLPGWPILSMHLALAFGVMFALQCVLVFGGIAWLQHYVLRWYLWRSGAFPARCVPFFDYATEKILLFKFGGGYIFAHRLLLDYFASLYPEEPECQPGTDAGRRGTKLNQKNVQAEYDGFTSGSISCTSSPHRERET